MASRCGWSHDSRHCGWRCATARIPLRHWHRHLRHLVHRGTVAICAWWIARVHGTTIRSGGIAHASATDAIGAAISHHGRVIGPHCSAWIGSAKVARRWDATVVVDLAEGTGRECVVRPAVDRVSEAALIAARIKGGRRPGRQPHHQGAERRDRKQFVHGGPSLPEAEGAQSTSILLMEAMRPESTASLPPVSSPRGHSDAFSRTLLR